MTGDPRRLGGLEYLLLFVVLASAAATRVGYLSACAANAMTPGPFQVQDAHGPDWTVLVENLSRDAGYATRADEAAAPASVAHPAPLYPALLATLRRFTADMSAAEHWLRWLQCGLGAATAALLFLFVRRAFHSNLVAVVAGLGAAFHPFWIISTAEIEDGVLASFLVAGCLFLGARASQSRGALTSWALGLTLAGLALTRAPLLPFAVIGLLWFLQRCSRLERGWLMALLAFLGFASGLGPWMVRNYLVFHEVYPVVDNSIHHLWLGNRIALPSEIIQAEDTETQAANAAEQLQDLWDGMRRQPSSLLERRLWAGLNFLFGEEWFKYGRLCIPSANEEIAATAPSWLNRSYSALLAGTLLGLFLLGLLGWRASYPWRSEAMPLALALGWIPVPYVLGHAELLSGPRLPWDGVLICYASYGLVWTVASLAHFSSCSGFGFDVEK